MGNKKVVVTKGSILFITPTVLFIVLKLTNLIDLSWWWVLALPWIPVAFLVSIGVLIVVVIFGAGSISGAWRALKRRFNRNKK